MYHQAWKPDRRTTLEVAAGEADPEVTPSEVLKPEVSSVNVEVLIDREAVEAELERLTRERESAPAAAIEPEED